MCIDNHTFDFFSIISLLFCFFCICQRPIFIQPFLDWVIAVLTFIFGLWWWHILTDVVCAFFGSPKHQAPFSLGPWLHVVGCHVHSQLGAGRRCSTVLTNCSWTSLNQNCYYISIWTSTMFISCSDQTAYEHIVFSFYAQTSNNLNMYYIQITFNLNIIWTFVLFRWCSDWTLSEHTICSDCCWFAHDMNIQHVQMIFDLNMICTCYTQTGRYTYCGSVYMNSYNKHASSMFFSTSIWCWAERNMNII